MKLSELKQQLENLNTVTFLLPDNTFVANHFHITEAGITTKNLLIAEELFAQLKT